MKYNLVVKEITHDELVSIFSMLPYECHFSVDYSTRNYNSIPKQFRNGTCFEDKVADCLLNGKQIKITDLQAEGVVYGNLDHNVNKDETVDYYLDLTEFLRGISNMEIVEHLKDLAEGNDDYWTAYNIIQCAIFGELIYG